MFKMSSFVSCKHKKQDVAHQNDYRFAELNVTDPARTLFDLFSLASFKSCTNRCKVLSSRKLSGCVRDMATNGVRSTGRESNAASNCHLADNLTLVFDISPTNENKINEKERYIKMYAMQTTRETLSTTSECDFHRLRHPSTSLRSHRRFTSSRDGHVSFDRVVDAVVVRGL